MSIIQEALKKTEDKLVRQAPPAPPPGQGPGPSDPSKKAISRAYILAPAALIALMAAGSVLMGLGAKHKPAPAAPAKEPAAPPAAAPASRQETVNRTVKEPPKFSLNGIMYMDNGPKAIVNGSVVKEGDLISGATVRKITRRNVVLECGDAELQLNLND